MSVGSVASALSARRAVIAGIVVTAEAGVGAPEKVRHFQVAPARHPFAADARLDGARPAREDDPQKIATARLLNTNHPTQAKT